MLQKSRDMQLLRWTLQFLTIVGVNPLKTSVFSGILAIISVFSINLMLVANVALLLKNWKGAESMEDMLFLPNLFLISGRSFWWIFKKKTILETLKLIDKFWPLDKFGKDECRLQEEHINFITKVLKIFFSVSITNSVFLILTASLSWKIVLPGFYGCNSDFAYCFIFVQTFQVVVIYWIIYPIVLGFLCLYVVFVTCALIGANMLIKSFKVWALILDGKHVPAEVDCNFIEIIKQHNVLFRFMDYLKQLYTEIFLIQVVFTLGAMVTSLYMITISGKQFGDLIIFGVIFVILYSELALYCILGSTVANKMLEVGDEAYKVEWYIKTQSKIRSSLRMIIMRSQKPTLLTAAKMRTINCPLLVTVLKNCLSMYTLLQTFTQKDKDNKTF